MSQKTEKYVASNEYERVLSMTCDICSKTVNSSQWPGGSNNIMDVEISMEFGWGYGGDGGSTEKYEYDICPECFMNKLMTWLAEYNAKPRISKHEW